MCRDFSVHVKSSCPQEWKHSVSCTCYDSTLRQEPAVKSSQDHGELKCNVMKHICSCTIVTVRWCTAWSVSGKQCWFPGRWQHDKTFMLLIQQKKTTFRISTVLRFWKLPIPNHSIPSTHISKKFTQNTKDRLCGVSHAGQTNKTTCIIQVMLRIVAHLVKSVLHKLTIIDLWCLRWLRAPTHSRTTSDSLCCKSRNYQQDELLNTGDWGGNNCKSQECVRKLNSFSTRPKHTCHVHVTRVAITTILLCRWAVQDVRRTAPGWFLWCWNGVRQIYTNIK